MRRARSLRASAPRAHANTVGSRRMLRSYPVIATLLCCTPAGPHAPDLAKLGAAGLHAIDAKQLEANTKLLSSDALRGREPGTDGDARAELFIAEQVHALRLEPA